MAEQDSLYAYPYSNNNGSTGNTGQSGLYNAPTYRTNIPPSSLKIYLVIID
jgi:hypothetical protein